MNRTRLMLISAFLAVFAAGAGAAILAHRVPPDDHRSFMAQRLNLTETQRQQLQDIWERARTQARDHFANRRARLREERDESIRQALRPEDFAKYQHIQEQHRQRLREMHDARREAFASVRQETRAILNDHQWAQWEDMTKRWRGRHRHGHQQPGGEPENHDSKSQ